MRIALWEQGIQREKDRGRERERETEGEEERERESMNVHLLFRHLSPMTTTRDCVSVSFLNRMLHVHGQIDLTHTLTLSLSLCLRKWL